MSLRTLIDDFIIQAGTDFKGLRNKVGDLTTLTTTDKTTTVAAINEVNAAIGEASIPDASETVEGKVELATQAETNAGTDDVRVITPLKFQTRMAAYAQPAHADLNSIVALTLDAYGLGFLELTNQAGLMALVQAASDTVQGKVELATDAEAIAGSDTARALTSANLAALFTDRIDTTTSLGASNVKVPSQNAVKVYVDGIIAAANAAVYKGVIDASVNPNYPAADAGWLYRISVAGKIGGASGPNVEIGDMILCLTDGTASGNHATVGAQWDIIQVNIDGAVVGPTSSVSGGIPTFNGTSGKIIQDSAVTISTDGTLASNSDSKVSTEKAVKTYSDALATLVGSTTGDLAAQWTTAIT